MEKKSRIRQPEFWNSAPTELERLTHFSRIEENDRIARGWRRNVVYSGCVAGFVLLLFVLRWVAR